MRTLLLALLVLIGATSAAKDQTAYAVWKGTACVQLLSTVEATAPMVDGKPDLKHVHVTGVQLDSRCMTYEIRK